MADLNDEAPQLVEAQTANEDNAEKLANLKASATKEYSLKNYGAAADFYSEATELQAEIHGEMAPQNAELLYAYGRCLYHVAISKSDVLGSKVAGEEPKNKKRKTDAGKENGADKLGEEIVEAAVEEKEEGPNKPFFQITGDENWTDSEEEEEDDEEGDGEDDDDDFANAYEVLDLARVLLQKQVDNIDASAAMRSEGKGKAIESQEISPEKRTVMERLADTHDLQAEIWLESERFSDAVPDFQSALELKLQLYPPESSLIAEAHYKLSLALEFASIRKVEESEAAEAPEKVPEVDEEVREEAISHMDKAIASCRLRVEKETSLLASASSEDKSKKEKDIKEVKEMIADLEQRLNDLKNPTTAPEGGPAGAPTDMIGGVLASILGESKAQQQARIAEATKGANDLSGLVKKKKAPQAAAKPIPPPDDSALKRKLADDEAESGITNGKKARVEDDTA